MQPRCSIGHASAQGLLKRRSDLAPELEEPLLRWFGRLIIGGRRECLDDRPRVHPRESPLLEQASRRDDFLVKPMAVATDDDQPSVRNHRWVRNYVIGYDPSLDPVQFLATGVGPDFRPQQAQAHLHQAMVEVDEHDVVPAVGHGMIEGNWTGFLRVRVLEPLGADGPASAQGGQAKDRPSPRVCHGDERGLIGELEPDFHDLLNVRGRQSQFFLGLPVLIKKRLDLPRQVTLELEHFANGLGAALGGLGASQGVATPEHGRFDIVGKHLADAAEVLSNCLDFLGHAA